MSIDLTPRLRAAADYIEAHGWTQGTEKDEQGHVCLTGAVRYCAPKTGDEYLIRAVLRRRDRAEAWNDNSGRTADDVLHFLRAAEVTDADLAETFGPQWEAIVALVRRAAALTEGEVERLKAAWAAAGDAARDAAWSAARYAAGSAGIAARYAGIAARYAAGSAGIAARYAAGALVVRDLIGQHGFTQAYYDTLTRPWRDAIGKVHPDDQDPA